MSNFWRLPTYIILCDKWKRLESFVISDQSCYLIWMSNLKFESWMGSGLALYFRNSCFQICLFSTLIFFPQDFTFLEKKNLRNFSVRECEKSSSFNLILMPFYIFKGKKKRRHLWQSILEIATLPNLFKLSTPGQISFQF